MAPKIQRENAWKAGARVYVSKQSENSLDGASNFVRKNEALDGREESSVVEKKSIV